MRYKELVKEEEDLEERLARMEIKTKQLEVEVTEMNKLTDSLAALQEEQDCLLDKLCKDENLSSDLERRLEEDLDTCIDKRERIVVGEYKWTNARVLLDHAVKQLGVACAKWISLKDIPENKEKRKQNAATRTRNSLMAASSNISSAQQYLDNITFPYCQPAEMARLAAACETVHSDMAAEDSYQRAYKLFNDVYTHASALLQWFDSVINNTINKDLQTATAELLPAQRLLRAVRLRLVKDRFGNEADDLELASEDEDDEEEAEVDFPGDEDTVSEVTIDTVGEAMDTEQQDDMPSELQYDMRSDRQDMMCVERQDTIRLERQTTRHSERQGTLRLERQNTMYADPQEPAKPLPLSQLAPPPSSEDLFGNIEQLKLQHQRERAEFHKRQETNKARLQMKLQEKLAARRERTQSRME